MDNEQRKFELYKLFIEIEYNSRTTVTRGDMQQTWRDIFYWSNKNAETALIEYEEYHASKNRTRRESRAD